MFAQIDSAAEGLSLVTGDAFDAGPAECGDGGQAAG